VARAKGDKPISINSASPLRPASRPARSDSALGIAYMAAGFFMFAAVDAQGKLLTDTLHPIQIAWSRQFGLLLGVMVMLAIRGAGVLRTQRPYLQIFRGSLAAVSATLFITAVAFVPLADAIAVAFVAPFVVTILGALVLGESVGIRRWTAVTIGFVGAMIVIRPGLGVVHPAVLLVVLAAAFFALRQILSRILSGSESTATTVAYTALAGSLLLSLPLPFIWRWPETTLEVALLISVGVLAALGELLVIKALEVAQAVVIAPMQYTLLLWGTIYGYLIFAELPDLWTWIGAAIIMATGLYTLHRERSVSRARQKAALSSQPPEQET